MATRLQLMLATTALIGLGACASSGAGSTGTPDPTLTGTGSVAGQKNLILTDLSYLHPSNSDGKDQTYDLATAFIVLEKDPDTGGYILGSTSRTNFSDQSTMTFTNATNTFDFNINTGDVQIAEAFDFMMLTNPVDIGFENNDMVVMISAQPELYGLDPTLYRGDPFAVEAYLIGLRDSADPADNDLFTALSNAVANRVASDWVRYSAGNIEYWQLKLSNNAVDTNYTTLGLWYDTSADNLTPDVFGTTVFGTRTLAFDMPTTGTASYETTMAGRLLLDNTAHFMTGGINFNFDFGTGVLDFIVDADLAETGTDGTTVYLDYDTFAGTGSVEGTTFTGDFLSQSNLTTAGTLEGAFFGAAADEVAGTFEFSSSGVLGIGGFIGANPEATSQN